MTLELDSKLFELQKACAVYKATDPLADWVLFAVTRYITTGRATRDFERMFLAYPDDLWTEMIKACLNGDRSDSGIMRTMKARLRKYS